MKVTTPELQLILKFLMNHVYSGTTSQGMLSYTSIHGGCQDGEYLVSGMITVNDVQYTAASILANLNSGVFDA